MHSGDSDFGEAEAATWEADKAEIARFAESRGEVREWQICPFLNLDNRRITLGGMSLADSTQDNGLCVQGGQFDFLLDLENRRPEVLSGQVYVPVCYRSRYDLSVGDVMAALSDDMMILVIFLVSIVVLLISMLCIRFLLLLQLERDRKEVGLLKALGVGWVQIRRLYLTRYLLFALCGALFGLLAAFLAKAPLEKQIRELYGAASGGWKTAALAFAAVCRAGKGEEALAGRWRWKPY